MSLSHHVIYDIDTCSTHRYGTQIVSVHGYHIVNSYERIYFYYYIFTCLLRNKYQELVM